MMYVQDPANPHPDPKNPPTTPYIATSNGDGTFRSKDDTAEVDPDASMAEAFDAYGAATPASYIPVLVIYCYVC